MTFALSACTPPMRHARQIAHAGHLQEMLLEGSGFRHRAFARVTPDASGLTVFIEGDGSPWVGAGRRPAADPTPRVPLALELAAETPGNVLYLGRPCYFGLAHDSQCSEREWTAERYSARVVGSLEAALRSFAGEHATQRVLLVGYSGGGTLAVLLANRLAANVAVVVIAGNLDPDEWTRLHGYQPLVGSLNPAQEPPLPLTLPAWYLVGDRDANVPAAATAAYFGRVPQARVLHFQSSDHVCCWVRDWPRVLSAIHAQLGE
jgi:pimeloyl-ACP methyl ester carboxylesterase